MRSVRVLAAAALTAGLVALPVTSAVAATATTPSHHRPTAECVWALKSLEKAKDDLKKAKKEDDKAVRRAEREVARAWDRVEDSCCLHRDHRGEVATGVGGTQSGTDNGALTGGAAAVGAAGIGGSVLLRRRGLGR